jgi:predicted GNAT family N-acyltransferase
VSAAAFSVRIAQWPCDEPAIAAIRRQVFVVELGVPAELERDGRDAQSLHAIAQSDAHAIGCARLLPDGYIGRIAVLREWRRRGVGGAMLECLVALAAQRGEALVALNAQIDACDFYSRHGFTAIGEPWLEGGLRHVTMQRRLRD